jgi:hypothetical protein
MVLWKTSRQSSTELTMLSAHHLRFSITLSLALLLLLVSCNSPTTPEEITSQFIRESEEAFEDNDILRLKKLISSQYRDSQNRTAGDVISIAAAYIRSSKSIYLFTDLDSAIYADDRIQARILAAFAARPISDPTILGQLQADIYWFDLVLAEEKGGWKLLAAQWQQAMVDDFFKDGSPDHPGDN